MAASNTSAYGAPPQLGAPIPGMTGGMPAQSGLSVMKNPMAKELESRGRSGDSMLVHMAPEEVGGLQNLAMAMGGSLSINPETGLVEANFLKKILPTLLGAGLSFIPGVGPLLAAGIVGGGQTLLTGDINKGLMAGLQAFGGASLGGAAGAGNVFGAKAAASSAVPSAASAAPASGFSGALNVPGMSPLNVAASQFTPAMSISGLPGAASIAGQAASAAAPVAAAKTGLAGFGQKFGQAASAGLGGAAAKYAPYAAGAGLLSGISDATTPQMNMPGQENKSTYEGPYLPQPRKARFRTPEEVRRAGGAEFSFFEDANPYPGFLTKSGGMPTGYAEGGRIDEENVRMVIPQLPEFRTAAPSQAAAGINAVTDLAALMQSFRNSPGAITASRDYESGSPRTRTGEADYGFGRPLATGTSTTGATPGGSGGGGADSGATIFQANPGANNQTTSASTAANIENTQHGLNQLNGVYRPDAPSPYVLDPSLPGTTIPGMNVSGQGVMPDFRLDPLRVNPVDMPVNGTYSPLSPGTTIPGMEVSGDGIMPDFTLDSLKVDPVIIPRTNVSSQYGTGGGYSGYGGEFGGSSPFGGMGGSLNSMGSFGNNLDSRISGGNYTFPTDNIIGSSPFGNAGSVYRGEFGGPSPFSDVYKDPEEYEEAKARGGEVGMDNGSFVVDARTVSELGNGSSNAGIEHLARMGGRPVRGAGDGVSDSVRARIGGTQEARVARDEVIFSPEAVARLGGGNHSKGTNKLYALMEKAHKARKKAGRGQDTKVAKGLGALA
jgi:hypothetical protein